MSVSKENSKLGKLINVSLTPIKSCSKGIDCPGFCYALNSYRRYPNTQKSWDSNLNLYKQAPTLYQNLIEDSLKKNPELFRWHVGGDIVDFNYFTIMVKIAKNNPNTTFLAYTKQYEYVNQYSKPIPDNFTIIFSEDAKKPMDNPRNYPIALVRSGMSTCPNQKDKRVKCNTCKKCFKLQKGELIIFDKHK
jgi:hypothetical protein